MTFFFVFSGLLAASTVAGCLWCVRVHRRAKQELVEYDLACNEFWYVPNDCKQKGPTDDAN